MAHWVFNDDRIRPHWAWALLSLLGTELETVAEFRAIIVNDEWTLERLVSEAKLYNKYLHARTCGNELPPLCLEILEDPLVIHIEAAQAEDCGCEMEDEEEEEDEEDDDEEEEAMVPRPICVPCLPSESCCMITKITQ